MHTSYLVHSRNENAVFANLGVRTVEAHTVVKYQIMCNSDYGDKASLKLTSKRREEVNKLCIFFFRLLSMLPYNLYARLRMMS